MYSEDRELVHDVLSGEVEALTRLVKKYNSMAGAISFGICGDFQNADDFVQEAFLKAYYSLRNLKDPGKFKVWFAGIVRSKAIDFIRQRKKFWSLSQDSSLGYSDFEAYSTESVEDLLLREEFRGKLLDAIRSLPEEHRLIVTLKHMEGLSYKEISEIMGTTVSAVESRLFRARSTLRKKLDHILR